MQIEEDNTIDWITVIYFESIIIEEKRDYFTSLRWFSSETKNISIEAKLNDHLIETETSLWHFPNSIPWFCLHNFSEKGLI